MYKCGNLIICLAFLCSVSSQAGAPAIFPPVTFPLGYGGHRRQQPQHPQLHVLKQDGQSLALHHITSLWPQLDACSHLCRPATVGFRLNGSVISMGVFARESVHLKMLLQ